MDRQNLIKLIEENEEWLIERILGYAKEQGYTKYTSTLEEAWRLSICGLSASLVEGIDRFENIPEFGPGDDFENDPLAAFGILEAQRHRKRGVTLDMFLGLMKYYAQSYIDLVCAQTPGKKDAENNGLFIVRCFDRIEIAFCLEWARTSRKERIKELQETNRLLTNEKNNYLTVFESLSDPVIFLNTKNEIVNLNHAAALLIDPGIIPGAQYYHPKQPRLSEFRAITDKKIIAKSSHLCIGKPLREVFPWLPAPRPGEGKPTPGAAAQPEETKKEIRAIIHGKQKYFEVCYSHMLDVSEKFAGIVLTLLDSTERKEFETQLMHAREAAEAASEAKSRFLSTMSHEIRTPLNAIIGMADVLAETPLSPDRLQFVQLIRAAGEDLLTLVNDILDISKIEAGQLELEHTPFHLPGMVEKTCEILAVRIHNKQLELKTRVAPDTPSFITGDPFRLRQVLTNLIGNAIKFTEKGHVTVEVEAKPFPGDQNRVRVLFSITDTGIGIPANMLAAIFDSFTQVDSSTTRKYGGTGLGLAISRRLVEIMGGNIEVTSQPGGGSCFTFSVVSERHAGPAVPVSPYPGAPGPGGMKVPAADNRAVNRLIPPSRLLLVEDSFYNRNVVEAFLMDFPVHIYIADNGLDAVEKFKRNRYDLVLMDIQMPVMDGLTAAREIRRWEKQNRRSPTPIIAMTAHAMAGDTAKSMESGCNEHLPKPMKKNDFLKIVGKYLKNVNLNGTIEAGKNAESKTGETGAKPASPAAPPEKRSKITVRVDPVLLPYVPDFLKFLKQNIIIIKNYLKMENFANIHALAHKMKGDGGTYGLDEVGKLGAAIQEAAETKNTKEIKRLMKKLSVYLDCVEVK
jgi:signal transduction histidine kinase/DNA-binding NarL/FixJ family response regulator/PAS domain-containing protein